MYFLVKKTGMLLKTEKFLTKIEGKYIKINMNKIQERIYKVIDKN
jgi:hypothetical protein